MSGILRDSVPASLGTCSPVTSSAHVVVTESGSEDSTVDLPNDRIRIAVEEDALAASRNALRVL